MAMKRWYAIALITVLTACIIVALYWKKPGENKIELPNKNISVTNNSSQARDEEISTKPKPLSEDSHTKTSSEPNQSHTASTLSLDKDEELLLLEQPGSSISHQDMMAVRIAMEKSDRPDLRNKPSPSERRRELHKKLQIPDAELLTLSTKDLLNKVNVSSMTVPMFIFPCADGGLSRYAASYNGVNAFLNRPDAAKVLLKKYKDAPNLVSEIDPKTGEGIFRFAIMDVLMSSKQVISQLATSEQKEEAIALIIKSIDAQAQYDASLPEPAYGESTLEYSGLAIAKYLEALQDAEYLQWFAPKRDTDLFTKYLPSTSQAKEIISMGRKYVEKY